VILDWVTLTLVSCLTVASSRLGEASADLCQQCRCGSLHNFEAAFSIPVHKNEKLFKAQTSDFCCSLRERRPGTEQDKASSGGGFTLATPSAADSADEGSQGQPTNQICSNKVGPKSSLEIESGSGSGLDTVTRITDCQASP